ncbi:MULTISPECIES: DUF7882 family protein [unclassified Microbacterium]|uniref:DUF7882 family protein n=1 Tax=unclassified Microbacterium TaxID=2609290 RepID=UPI00109B8D80|nr:MULTISPECIES: hypothetical protein [unclassified Microbacterium]MBN6191181.1 hypothetical protein [Aneurinibacillus sp. BA2021]
MGTLTYANATAPIEIDDEVLAHLRAATVTKLRRNEPFALTVPTGDGQSETLWMHASIPVRFALDSTVELHRPLLARLMQAASSTGGLDLTDSELSLELASRELHAMTA